MGIVGKVHRPSAVAQLIGQPLPQTAEEMAKHLKALWAEREQGDLTCEPISEGVVRLIAVRTPANGRDAVCSEPRVFSIAEFNQGPIVVRDVLTEIARDLKARLRFANECPTVWHALAAQGWFEG
jgi:hypothetical protein